MESEIKKSFFSNLYPLSLIADQYQELLHTSCKLETFGVNKTIIRKPFSNKDFHYLLSGCVEIRKSFENRVTLNSSSENAFYALEEAINEGGVIRAKTDCRIIVVSVEEIDRLLALSQSDNHKYAANTSLNNAIMIDENIGDDWVGKFFQSRLASHLPSIFLQELFTKLEDVEYLKEDVVIKKSTPGDYFYVVKNGCVQILTDNRGPYQGDSFELSVGDFFGDEALIADTIRNATVVMKTDGILGRLEATAFNKIIKEHLVVPIEKPLEEVREDFQYVDVRFPIEYKYSHVRGAKNIPISHLRKKLDRFNHDDTYIFTAEGGRRSELGTYLLRQAGIKSFYIPNNI